MVFDDTFDLPSILLRIAGFFRDESCGQCVPCRVGTVRQEEALLRITSNGHQRGSNKGDLTLLRDVGQAMRDASICGLGQTAWNAVESAKDVTDVVASGVATGAGGTSASPPPGSPASGGSGAGSTVTVTSSEAVASESLTERRST